MEIEDKTTYQDITNQQAEVMQCRLPKVDGVEPHVWSVYDLLMERVYLKVHWINWSDSGLNNGIKVFSHGCTMQRWATIRNTNSFANYADMLVPLCEEHLSKHGLVLG